MQENAEYVAYMIVPAMHGACVLRISDSTGVARCPEETCEIENKFQNDSGNAFRERSVIPDQPV